MGRWTVSISSRREETASKRWCLRSGTDMEKSDERVLEVRKLSREGYFNQSNHIYTINQPYCEDLLHQP